MKKFNAVLSMQISVSKIHHAFGVITYVDLKNVLILQFNSHVVLCGQKMTFYNADGNLTNVLILQTYPI